MKEQYLAVGEEGELAWAEHLRQRKAKQAQRERQVRKGQKKEYRRTTTITTKTDTVWQQWPFKP